MLKAVAVVFLLTFFLGPAAGSSAPEWDGESSDHGRMPFEVWIVARPDAVDLYAYQHGETCQYIPTTSNFLWLQHSGAIVVHEGYVGSVWAHGTFTGTFCMSLYQGWLHILGTGTFVPAP